MKPEERVDFESEGTRPAVNIAFQRGHLEGAEGGPAERLVVANTEAPADDPSVPLREVQEVVNESAIELGWAIAGIDWQLLPYDSQDAEASSANRGHVVLVTLAPLGRRLGNYRAPQVNEAVVEYLVERKLEDPTLGAVRLAGKLNDKASRSAKYRRPRSAEKWTPRAVQAVMSGEYFKRAMDRAAQPPEGST